MSPIFAPTGQFQQHDFLCVGTLLCRDFPTSTYVPRTDDNHVSLLLFPTSNVDLHNHHLPTKYKKSSVASIPSRHVFFTSCHLVTSHCTRFVCLFVRLFVRLVDCCIISLPLVVASCPVALPHHVIALRRVSRCPSCLVNVQSLRHCVVALSRCCVVVSSRRWVVALSRCRVVALSRCHVVALSRLILPCCCIASRSIVISWFDVCCSK